MRFALSTFRIERYAI